MADSQNHEGDTNDLDFLFDFEEYYDEQPAEPESTPNVTPPAPNNSTASNPGFSLELHQERVSLSEAPDAHLLEERTPIEIWGLSPGGLSMPATDTGNGSLHQYEQPSNTNNVTAEICQVDDELAEVQLELKQRRLQKRRQELLQTLPTRQPIQTPERPQFQGLEPAIVPFIEFRTGQNYNAPTRDSGVDALQRTSPDIDSHYNVGSNNSLTLGFPNLSSYPQEAPFDLGNSEQPGMINAWPLSMDTTQSSNSVPTSLTDLGHNRQYGMQGPSLASSSEKRPIGPHSIGPQYGQDLMNSPPPLSTMSSVQHHQSIQSPEKGLVTRKRPRSPQPNMSKHLSALQRQAKQIGVPENSLDIMCFNKEPRSKRPRTSSQKQNKKDVQDAGGSCFLCLVFKKKVEFWNFPTYLILTELLVLGSTALPEL